MKKLSSNTSLVAFVLGALLILFALSFIAIGGEATVIGIFGLLSGIAYVLGGIFVTLNLSDKAITLTKDIIFIVAFPLFIFVYYLIIVIEAANALSVTNWILSILLLISALSAVVCGIITLVGNNEMVKKIANLSILLFIGIMVILLVFPLGGGAGGAALGDLSLVQIFFIAGYFLITKPFLELPKFEKKEEKVTEESASEEAMKEEPKEETKVDEKVEEEPQAPETEA